MQNSNGADTEGNGPDSAVRNAVGLPSEPCVTMIAEVAKNDTSNSGEQAFGIGGTE